MKAKEIIQLIENWVSPKLIEYWDNTGFQIGDHDKEVNRILVALDLDEEVLQKALEEDFQMIITHHPIIFKPVGSITTLNHNERLLYNLIKNDIVAYNAHTNLDLAEGGVNDELANLLGLEDTRPLKLNSLQLDPKYGFGRVGNIKKVDLIDYIEIIKEKLNIDYLKVYGKQERNVKRVAVCGGSGSEFITDAFEANACIYITGDIKYHDAQLGANLGLTIIDAGHYHTEKIILPVIKKYLDQKTNNKLYVETLDRPSPNYKIY